MKVSVYSDNSLPWYQNPSIRSLMMGIGALLLYGLWAFISNFSHGLESSLKAAFTQGFISLTITVVVTATMEFTFRKSPVGMMQIIIPFVLAQSLSSSYTIGCHWFMKTPEILNTVIPVLLVGAVYNLIYTLNLVREKKARIS